MLENMTNEKQLNEVGKVWKRHGDDYIDVFNFLWGYHTEEEKFSVV